eukprot:m.23738 g.23738  ORF g.23738 m.23738 type:complete len:638 (+) comp4099_c0_seq1:116-2029(+)
MKHLFLTLACVLSTQSGSATLVPAGPNQYGQPSVGLPRLTDSVKALDTVQREHTDTMQMQTSVGDMSLFPGLGVSLVLGPSSWVNTTYSESDFTMNGPGDWSLTTPNFTASITLRMGGFFRLTLNVPNHNVSRVSFPLMPSTPLDSAPDMYALLPFLGGIFVRAGASCYADCMDDDVNQYPGGMHAPYVIVATPETAIIAAAVTWPPQRVHPKRRLALNGTGPQPLLIDWTNGWSAGSSPIVLDMLLKAVDSTDGEGNPWQNAVLQYKTWLHFNRPPPPPLPAAMVASEGMMAVGLMNMPSFNLTSLDAQWQEWSDVLNRVQFWGQMSNYCGPPRLAKPPLKPNESTGCCLLEQPLHPRYVTDCAAGKAWAPGSQCLPAWARHVADSGGQVGYYTRAGVGGFLGNLTWIEQWLGDMAEAGGNAQYVDTFARVFNGNPAQVLDVIAKGTPPADVIVEGWNDLYPFAGLLSGYHKGFDWCNATNNTIIYDMGPFGNQTHGSFIKLVRLLMGDAIGYFGYEDGEHEFFGPAHNWFSERQAFLLGAKHDAGSGLSSILRVIKGLRDKVQWWSRGFSYMDTIGITNSHADLIDVRRHDDTNDKTVLVVDNFRNISGLSVTFKGQTYPVTSDMLSIIEVPSTT